MEQTVLQPDIFGIDRLRNAINSVPMALRSGSVVRITGLMVESTGPQIGIGQLCSIHLDDGSEIFAEVIGFRSGNLIMMPLESVNGISPGNKVSPLSAPRQIMVSENILGRVLDGLGRPIDNKGPLVGNTARLIENMSVSPLTREKISQPLSLGIRSIDGLLTCGKGQRLGIFAGSGVGKSVLLGEIANSSQASVNVVALVGERGREVREFLEEDLGEEGLARTVVVVATSDAPAIQRIKAPFLAVTIAEYFRDIGCDVLFMMDSMTRMAQAQREIGLAAGEPPATKGYCPSVFAILPKLVERLGCSDNGSITGILTVLAEGDDLNDPVADCARSLLDGHLVLSRKLASKGHYPAIDVLSSVSRLMNAVAEPQHSRAAQKFKEIYATYSEAEDLINIGAFSSGSNKRIDGAVALIDQIKSFLIQPVRQKTSFEQTIAMIMDITSRWDNMIGLDVQQSHKIKAG